MHARALLVRSTLVAAVLAVAGTPLIADRLVLRNGRSVDGRVVSLRGDTLEFEDARDGRVRRVDRRDIRRIEFDDDSYDTDYDSGRSDWNRQDDGGRPRGMRERQVLAYANTPWSDTGIDVRAGQTLYFQARGEVRWGKDRKDGPAGEDNSPRNPGRPIPNRPGAALIGKIGDGSDAFFIGGDQGAIRVRASGRLYLGINDDYLQDNNGFFTVIVYH